MLCFKEHPCYGSASTHIGYRFTKSPVDHDLLGWICCHAPHGLMLFLVLGLGIIDADEDGGELRWNPRPWRGKMRELYLKQEWLRARVHLRFWWRCQVWGLPFGFWPR